MVAGTDPTLCLTPLRLMTRTAHHNNAERYRPHQRYRWFTANPPLNIGVSAGREGGQGTTHRHTAPGEQIFAIQVNRVKYRTW